MYYLGVDTGGTFTDFALFRRDTCALQTFKVRSVPSDPGAAIVIGLDRMKQEFGVPASECERFIFGTTVATNAVLERKGAKVALLTTRGMRDVLEIQRQWRRRLFDLYLQKPPALAPRRYRLEVDERITASGEVLIALTDAEVERCIEAVAALDIDAVAISFLFSFLHPEHEQYMAAALRKRLPHLHVTISSEVSPEFREYERTATTVMNAYTIPKISALARRIEGILKDVGFKGTFGVIQSNGGIMSLETARTRAVNTLLSGPAGGVVGATVVAGYSSVGNILGFDVGGTSTDITLVENGKLRVTAEGGIAGYPIKVPQVSVHTIGAGGGSIAQPVLGMLKVGPESAGANPGPVCYGGGGTEPTGTDAAVVLGYIDPDYFAGGEIKLDCAGARAAIEAKVARPLGLDTDVAALSILDVQVANIIGGMRKVTVEVGRDPRDFVLLPFGGAGGLYAGLVAEEAGMSRIMLPQHPSVLSALGMLMTDVRHDGVVTRVSRLDRTSSSEIAAIATDLANHGIATLGKEGIERSRIRTVLSCDMRYVGQAYELNVPVPDWPDCREINLERLAAAFHEQHRLFYGQCSEGEPVEIVSYRIETTGLVEKAELRALPPKGAERPAPRTSRDVLFGRSQGWSRCPVFERSMLAPEDALTGPAIIEDRGSSFVLRPGHRLLVDAVGNIFVDVPQAATKHAEEQLNG